MADKSPKKQPPVKIGTQASMENLPINGSGPSKSKRSPRNGKPKMI
jgi:hypothetical protein